VALLTAVVALAGCPAPKGAAPEETLAAYLRALEGNRLDEAYGLMSADYRKTHDRAAFERALQKADRKAAGQLKGTQVTIEAEIELGEGDKLPLVLEHGEWKLGRDPLDFYPQRTPEEAMRSFLRAVENKRYDVVLRFVPARYRATITTDKLRERWEGEKRQELLGQLERVRAHLGEPLVLAPAGDEAQLPLPDAPDSNGRKQARLVKEDGAWKVDALE
jgi:hypothetical protein